MTYPDTFASDDSAHDRRDDGGDKGNGMNTSNGNGTPVAEAALFAAPAARPVLKTVVIRRGSKLDNLFKGFRRFRGISYVATPATILEFLDEHAFDEVELILGENLTSDFRAEFQKNRAVLERLAERMEQGRLRILVPRGHTTIHTKLYFLDRGDGPVRFISTSSNLTRTGTSGAQVNHAVTGDLPADDPLLVQLLEDYQAHREMCEPFLGDLMDLLGKEKERARAFDAWLAAVTPDVDVERKKISAELLERSLEALETGGAAVTLDLPPNADAAKHLQKTLIDPAHGRRVSDRTYSLEPGAVATHVQKTLSGMPLMRLDREKRRLTIWTGGRFHERAAGPGVDVEFGRSLDHLERYVETVRFGKTGDDRMARAAIWEALLSLLSAPFSHEEMRGIRERYSTEVVSRGPAILCVHGPSHNGKTTILKFALKLICGFPVQPLPGTQFAPARVRAATASGNLFPLVFDDILSTGGVQALESVVKSYWEQGWSRDIPHPQLVLTTNREAFKTWAKTRMKKLAFDIEYGRDAKGTRALSDLFDEPSCLFPAFAREYLESLASGEDLDLLDDPIVRARRVFERLYAAAGRRIPAEFPVRAFELEFDHEKNRWRKLLKLKTARVVRRSDEVCVEFASGFLHSDITEYHLMLPQGIKNRRQANLIVIESPAEFEAWIGPEYLTRGLWGRLARLLPFRSKL